MPRCCATAMRRPSARRVRRDFAPPSMRCAPRPDTSGIATVTVTVSDGQASTPSAFQVEVVAVAVCRAQPNVAGQVAWVFVDGSLEIGDGRVGLSCVTQQLAALNAIGTGSTLRVGQKLKVRDGVAHGGDAAAMGGADGRRRMNYTVQGGDSVARIADRFNVEASQVLAWNGMNPARPLIRPGQILVLYVEQKLADARNPG